MSTRFYFPATTASDVDPAFDGNWTTTTGAVRRKLVSAKGSSAVAISATTTASNGSSYNVTLIRQYVSEPLAAQSLTSSITVKMQLAGRELDLLDNVDEPQLCIYIVSNDGATPGDVMLPVTATVAETYGTGPSEWINNATCRNVTFSNAAGSAAFTAGVTINAGDRLVVEVGWTSSVGGTTPQAACKFGENATDLPENDTTTTDGAGWIEFSETIAFSTSPIAAALTGTAAVAANLKGAGALASGLTGTATVAGTLRGAGAAVSGLTGTCVVTGILSCLVSASLTGSSTVSADLKGAGTLASGLTGAGALSGTLLGAGALASGLTGTATVAATLSAGGTVAVGLSGTCTVAGTLRGAGRLLAGLTGSGTCTGLLVGVRIAVVVRQSGAVWIPPRGVAPVCGPVTQGAIVIAPIQQRGQVFPRTIQSGTVHGSVRHSAVVLGAA